MNSMTTDQPALAPTLTALDITELRVLSGLHQGAALPLIGDQWTLGDNDDHDLALMDPELSGARFELQRDLEGWVLEGRDALIADGEGHRSARSRLLVNQPFAIGNVWLCLSPADSRSPAIPVAMPALDGVQSAPPAPASVPAEKRSRPSYGHRLAVAGLVVTIASSAWAFTRPAVEPIGHLAAPSAVPAVDASTARKAERKQLQHMLSDRLLDNDISISEDDKGLVLKGALKGDAFALYQRMIDRARAQLPAGVTLTDEVNVFVTHLPFVIVQVLNGPQAHIVTADGRRMFIGDQREGVKLVSIDDKTIEFDGDQHYKVNW